jgi:hypothetical protein
VGQLEACGDRILGRWPRAHLVEGESEPGELTKEAATAFTSIIRVAAVLVAVQCALHLVDAAVLDLRITRLDADSDKSVWSWLGSASELTAAFGAALLMVAAPVRWRWLGFLTLVFGFFSMDDAVRVHEGLGNLPLFADAGLSARLVWPALYAPLLLITCIQVWRVSGGMTARCRLAARGGLVALGLAVVLEFALSTVLVKGGLGRSVNDTRVGSMLYEYEVIVEEALELAGWLLVAAGLIATGVDLLVRRAHASGDLPASQPL